MNFTTNETFALTWVIHFNDEGIRQGESLITWEITSNYNISTDFWILDPLIAQLYLIFQFIQTLFVVLGFNFYL